MKNKFNDAGHVLAVIGTGRVGRATLLLLTHENWIDKLSLVDTEPGLAEAISEEARHALAGTDNTMEVASYESDAAVSNADIVLVTVGTPRDPTMDERADLTEANAREMKRIADETVPKNPDAKYVIVTNPVDAMATLFRDISGVDWVISTGTNLETLRFKSELSKRLSVPTSKITGYVAGEHGEKAVFLWSTVEINGLLLDDYLKEMNKDLDRRMVEEAVKGVSKQIIDQSGGTRMGPAVSFRDILRVIALDRNLALSVATPYYFENIKDSVFVSLPTIVGGKCRLDLDLSLPENESLSVNKAAETIYRVFQRAKSSVV